MKRLFLLFFGMFYLGSSYAQNPPIAGYFADPSIREFDGKYYVYATTDGHEKFGIGGTPLVWVSDDLVQWTPKKLEGINIEYFWAPAVIKADNNKFYLYNTHGVNYTGMVWESETPIGPWKFKNELVGFDIEPFKDPKTGKFYLTTNSSALLELNNDRNSDGYMTEVVASHELKGVFPDLTEGAYLFYRDGYYYMTWSGGRCWEDSYRVHYAVSKNIFGPYDYGKNNPVISSRPEDDIWGPGHHSVLPYKGKEYLVYHRQDRSHSDWCDFRFLGIAELTFDGKDIKAAKPIDVRKVFGDKRVNLALNKLVFSGGQAVGHEVAKINDGDYATRWEGSGYGAYVTIDMGVATEFSGMDIHMEYPDKYTTFKIELSDDNQHWQEYENQFTFARKAFAVSSIKKNGKARFIKIKFANVEGRKPSIWEWEVWK